MGLYDEQFNFRKRHDQMAFEETLLDIDAAATGKNKQRNMSQSHNASDAVSEILKYYDIREKESEFQFGDDLQSQLEYRIEANAISYRSVELKKGWYKNAMGPMIGFLEDGSSVALIQGKFGQYYISDTESGTFIKIDKNTENLLSEDAICFYKPLPRESLSFMDLLKYIKSILTGREIAISALTLGAAILLDLLVPILYQLLIGTVIEEGSIKVFLGVGIFLLCSVISSTFIKIVNGLVNSSISDKVDITIQSAVMSRILSLPTDFFSKYSSGELAQKIEDVNAMCVVIIDTVFNGLMYALFNMAFLIQIIIMVPKLVIPAIAYVVISILFILFSIKSRTRDLIAEKEAIAADYAVTYSMLTGVQQIKLAGAEKRAFAKWGKGYVKEVKEVFSPDLFAKIYPVINTAIGLLMTMAIYYVSVQNKISAAEYYAFIAAYGMLTAGVSAFADSVENLAFIISQKGTVEEFLTAVPEIEEKKQVVTKLTGRISLDHISFRYTDDSPYVLNDLSLNIRSGEYLAIVGTTGCGKSTLLRILLGFETPQKGSVYYDGKPLSMLDIKSVRKRIGTVLQKGRLIQESIFENIVLSHPELTMDDAWEAAEIAGIADDIDEMPMGMNTLISEGSGGISGGQRQRILIARAVAAKPKILFFDEATSALDNVTQKKVSDAIDELKCTRIVIAHRLSTIRNCDRIIVMDEGQIKEQGTYEELIKQNGLFTELVKRQLIDQPE